MIRYLNYLTILLLPTYLVKIPLATGISLNLLDFLLILSITYNLFYIFRKGNFQEFFRFRVSFKIGLFLFLSAYTLSFILNFKQEFFLDNLGLLKSFLLLPILFSLSASFLVYKKQLSLTYFLSSYLLLTSFLAIAGFIYFFLSILTFDSRLELFFNSPNALAMLLAPGILILLFYLKGSNGLKNLLLLLLLFFHSFSTIATASLGSFISLFILLLLFISLKKISFNLTKIYRFFIFFIILFSFFLPLFSFLLINSTSLQKNSSSFYSRIVIYDVTRQITSTNFIEGIGAGNFQKRYLSAQKNNPPYPQWAVPHPHNNLLLILVEGGILGLLGFLILLITRPLNKKMPSSILLFFIFFYFLLHGLIDTSIWKNDLAVFFWLIFGFLQLYPQPLSKRY
jgi:O-antigen ligase